MSAGTGTTGTTGAGTGAAAVAAGTAPDAEGAAGPAPVLTFDDVQLSFSGVRALDGVSFDVGAQELFAIIGPNGAGKTSIFNVLSGVYRPQRGHVRFLDRDVLGMRPHAIADLGISRTFQNIELFENLTVVDNLMLGRHHAVTYRPASAMLWLGRARRQELHNRAHVEDIVDFLEIEQYRKMPVGLLPYGIQKRVELGRALAMEPRLLLLDEPVAGMNLEETEDMARFIPRHPRRARRPDDPRRARHGPGHGPRRPRARARLRPPDPPSARPPRSRPTRT